MSFCLIFNTLFADFVSKMLEKFPDTISEGDVSGRIPLHYAAYYGDTEVVEQFLEKNISGK